MKRLALVPCFIERVPEDAEAVATVAKPTSQKMVPSGLMRSTRRPTIGDGHEVAVRRVSSLRYALRALNQLRLSWIWMPVFAERTEQFSGLMYSSISPVKVPRSR